MTMVQPESGSWRRRPKYNTAYKNLTISAPAGIQSSTYTQAEPKTKISKRYAMVVIKLTQQLSGHTRAQRGALVSAASCMAGTTLCDAPTFKIASRRAEDL